MTLKEQYKREWRNYLRRVNRAVKQGYQVQPIQKVKRPTRASIRRLQQQTGERIRSRSELVDITTGEILPPIKDKKNRKAIQRQNVKVMSQSLQTVQDTVSSGTVQVPVDMSESVLSVRDSYEQIIDNWYEQIHTNFYWYIGQFIESRTNQLIEGKDAETRRRFAYVLTQNPNIFPEAPYDTRESINDSFNQIARMMELAPDSEAYQDFVSMYDYVEREDL